MILKYLFLRTLLTIQMIQYKKIFFPAGLTIAPNHITKKATLGTQKSARQQCSTENTKGLDLSSGSVADKNVTSNSESHTTRSEVRNKSPQLYSKTLPSGAPSSISP